MGDLMLMFGMIAVILTVTALASGLVERSPLSLPLIFLGLGLFLGHAEVGVLDVGPHDLILEVVAALTMALVLFLDAAKLQVDEMGKRWFIPFLVLGPGTGVIIALGAVPLALVVGFGWTIAFIGGAVLASTDPVILREIIRDHRIPRSVRQILRVEAGMNDIVVLPIVLVLIAVAGREAAQAGEWVAFLLKLLVLGPAIGFAIGGIGAWLMSRIDRRFGVRQEYQALYGIGLVLAAYTATTSAGGDGFLGAFAAGFAVVALNQTLCDCFLDYGETTSEVAMLLSFVLFGAALSGMVGEVQILPALGLAAIVIFLIRPGVLSAVLLPAKMSWEARGFIAWFGPRGLNSLLLALLVVQAGIPGSEMLLATVGVVVIASVVIHSASASPISEWYARRAAAATLEEERESGAPALFIESGGDVRYIAPEELWASTQDQDAPIILDVRSRSSYDALGSRIPQDIRVLPDEVIEWASDQPRDRLIVAYCA